MDRCLPVLNNDGHCSSAASSWLKLIQSDYIALCRQCQAFPSIDSFDLGLYHLFTPASPLIGNKTSIRRLLTFEIAQPEGRLTESLLSCPCNPALPFNNWTALISHLRAVHGYRRTLSTKIITNQCPLCLSSFLSLQTAREHIAKSTTIGGCVKRKVQQQYPIAIPIRLQCYDCARTFKNINEYNDHVRRDDCNIDVRLVR